MTRKDELFQLAPGSIIGGLMLCKLGRKRYRWVKVKDVMRIMAQAFPKERKK